MSKQKSVLTEMLSLLERAGADELEEIDGIILARESELEEYVAAKRKEIDALHQIRKVCDLKLNGKPQRKARKAKDGEPEATTKTGIPSLADWIAARLEERGPQTTQQLAAAKGCSEQGIKLSISKARGRFVMNDDQEWDLAQP